MAGGNGGDFFDVPDTPFPPVFKYGSQQILTILEMPVKTALGDAAALGQHFDAQTGDALPGEHLDGPLDPVSTVELGAWRGHLATRRLGRGLDRHVFHTLPYAFPYDTVWSLCGLT